MTLKLPQVLIDEMIAHSREDLPNECCGIIGRAADGALTLWRATNDQASPWRFNIPAQQLLHLYNAIEDVDGDPARHLSLAHRVRGAALADRPQYRPAAQRRDRVALLGLGVARRRAALGARLADRRRRRSGIGEGIRD